MPEVAARRDESDAESTRYATAPAPNDTQHLVLIISFFRAFVAWVTLAYAGLIAVLCVHWVRAGEFSVLFLALAPTIMLLFLNVVVWMARKPK